MAMTNSVTFGGIDSATYGIYISGEGIFNAPARSVEMVAVPGRNGEIAIDQGRFENITVTYPAYVQKTSLATFSQALEQYRNAIMSLRGYQRLTDSIHTGEFRMAMFNADFEVKPIMYNTVATFDLVFTCKPQRFLTTGETVSTVTSGGTLTNPSKFESSPLLQVKGYGQIHFNGYTVDLNDPYLGDVMLIPPEIMNADPDTHTVFGRRTADVSDVANANDIITIGKNTISWYLYLYQYDIGDEKVTGASISSESGALGGTSKVGNVTQRTVRLVTTLDEIAVPFAEAPIWTYQTHTVSVKLNYYQNSTNKTKTFSATFSVGYQILDGEISVQWSADFLDSDNCFTLDETSYSIKGVTVDSTIVVLGNPTYVDCEIGECYKIVGTEVVDLNSRIDLGSDLPTLASGSNTITFDNTITELKVEPRWWII